MKINNLPSPIYMIVGIIVGAIGVYILGVDVKTVIGIGLLIAGICAFATGIVNPWETKD